MPPFKSTTDMLMASGGTVPLNLTSSDGGTLTMSDVSGNGAHLIGITPKEVSTALSSIPSNVPFIVARYEPLSMILHIDMFKLVATKGTGQAGMKLLTAPFSPAYGEYWKASGAYLSVGQRRAGTSTGPNPFSSFGSASANDFTDITLSQAMVVVGHAQRYSGAPISLLVQFQPKQEQSTTKTGNIFKKKITTNVDYSAKPEYYLGGPASLQGGITASFCANDPTVSNCAGSGYQVASSGVSFMKLSGGNLNEGDKLLHHWSQSKSGYTLLSVFILVFVISFAIAVVGPAVSAYLTGTGAVAGAPLGAGFWTGMLAYGGTGATTATGAALLEASLFSGATSLGGGGFGGVYESPGWATSQQVSRFPSADLGHPSVNEYREVVNGRSRSNTSGEQVNFIGGEIDATIPSVKSQFIGACPLTETLNGRDGQCGIIPRADQYSNFNNIEFIRDNGKPVRAGSF
jgi:hypothetical protein